VYVDQDVLDRIMGLYDVHIASATASSGIEAHIDGVEHAGAEGLKKIILDKITGDESKTPNAVHQSARPSAAPVKFSEEISSKTYPITGAWLVGQAFGMAIVSAIYAGLILIYLVVPGKDSDTSIGQDFGWSASQYGEAFLVLFAILFTAHFIYSILWRATYSFAFLPDYIVRRQGIIAKSENHLPYRSVQDVTVSQSIIDRVLGIATVVIENAAAPQMVGKLVISSAIKIPGQPLDKANKLSEVVKSITLTTNSSHTGV
jgi:membrane protein YdbS with pleckstrin-like domain